MADFIQLLVAGLATGGIYALVAIGFTLVWQTSQTINFAQGEFVMLPAFFMLGAMSVLGIPFWGAVVVGILVSAIVLGVLFKRLLVDPMLRHGVLPLAIATMALALFLKEAVKDFYSAEAQPFPPLAADINVSVFGAAVALQSLIVVAIAIGAVVALQLFLNRTQTGRRMQATAQNPTVARILGIPVGRMILLAFVINAVLAALASALVTPIYLAKFSNGEYLGIAAIIAGLIAAPFGLKPYGIYILTLWAVTAIAAIGLNLTLGYAGQVSLAQGAFVGIGAYAAALLTTHGWPLGAAYLIAGVSCFGIGWVLGYPALRVQHHYLAFVTLAFSTLLYLILRNEEWITGGIYGISNIPRPNLFGYLLRSPRDFYYFCLANLALVSLAAWWLIRSPWGRAFVALRENPVRALSLGVDTRRYTLMAFALGAGLGGVSGALYAPLVQYIDPTPFSLLLSLNLLLMVIVGGAGYFFGPFLGAVVAVLLPEWLQAASKYYLFYYAAFVMVLLVFSPSGIIGFFEKRLTAQLNPEPPPAPATEVKVA